MTSAAADLGEHLLGRNPSDVDERDKQFMAADALREIKHAEKALPMTDATLKLSLNKLWSEGYFHTQANAIALFRFVKAHHVPPAPGPGPSPSPTPVPSKRARVWNLAALLDQGQTPHCVGFGGAHWGIADPVNDAWTHADAEALYYACKVLDGEPKAEDGSSVRTLAQQLLNQGRIGTYVWCARVDETGAQQGQAVSDWLLNQGPVVFGTDWYQDMFNPDQHGIVKPTGGIAGGHCYLGVGVDLDAGLIDCANSWSVQWGLQGHFKIAIPDMQRLLDSQGEAMAGLELPLAA